jgi:hypothetical protein
MISIVISACLNRNPSVCREYRVPRAANVDTKGCLFQAQPHLPKWAEQHPQWEIKRWRCAPGDYQDL